MTEANETTPLFAYCLVLDINSHYGPIFRHSMRGRAVKVRRVKHPFSFSRLLFLRLLKPARTVDDEEQCQTDLPPWFVLTIGE
jgi:hypothetical protein